MKRLKKVMIKLEELLDVMNEVTLFKCSLIQCLGDKCFSNSPDLLNNCVFSLSACFVLWFVRPLACLLACFVFGRGDSDVPPCCRPAVSLSPNEEQLVSGHMGGRHGDVAGLRSAAADDVHRPQLWTCGISCTQTASVVECVRTPQIVCVCLCVRVRVKAGLNWANHRASG